MSTVENHLSALTAADCEQVRRWRSGVIDTLRTPMLLTEDMQAAFYRDVVCNRAAPHRYYALREQFTEDLLACVGLTNLAWENRTAEISLIVHPTQRGQGVGRTALWLLAHEAFDRLNLKTLYAECYACNEALGFWQFMKDQWQGYETVLPNRKYAAGQYWDAHYFSWDVDAWRVAVQR